MPWPIELRVGWASPDGAEDLTGALRIAEQRLAAQTTRPHGDLP